MGPMSELRGLSVEGAVDACLRQDTDRDRLSSAPTPIQESSSLHGKRRRIRDGAAAAGTYRFTEEPAPALLSDGDTPLL
jgi:hypothetical protein